MIRRELLTFAVALGIQQLSQESLDLTSLRELAIQLRHQIQHHLLQDLWIFGEMFRVDGHQ